MYVLQLLLLVSIFTSAGHVFALVTTDDGTGIDPHGGAVANAGSSMDPNGNVDTDDGAFIDPNG